MILFFAKLFAIFAHTSIWQRRKYTDEPYWYHCREVVNVLRRHGIEDPQMLAAAWLHDTVEDTWVTHWMIRICFGETVARYVVGLTDVTTLADGNRKFRKAIECARLAATCAEVQTIKAADLYCNTLSITMHDVRFLKKAYLPEAQALYHALTKADPGIRMELNAILDVAEATVKSSTTEVNSNG